MGQDSVEDLLLTNGVDLAIWGHFHAFQRFCKLAHGQCVDKDGTSGGAAASSSATGGVTHLVIGMAGYDHSQCPTGANWTPDLLACDDKHWGYTRLSFENATALRVEFVNGADGRTLQDFAVPRNMRSVQTADNRTGKAAV